MSEPEETQYTQNVAVNTPQHEQILSEASKGMVGGVLDLCASSLNSCIEQMKKAPNDPLAAEKFIHLADRLSCIAERVYDLGERARLNAELLYQTALRKGDY